MQEDEEISFLIVVPLIQRIIHSCRNKNQFPYTRTQFYIFSMLSLRGTMTMKEVAEYISASREQATRAVAPLVDDGYVERYILPDNRLHVHLRLTQAGQDFFSSFVGDLCARINEQLNIRLSAEDLADLHGAVKTIVRILGSL